MSSERGDILQLRLDRGRKLVEGTWKQFQFKMITPEDYPRVFECLHKNFFNSTPLTKAFEYSKAYYDEFDKVYLEVLPQNLSFCAIDTNTNEVVAVRVIFVHDRQLDEKLAGMGWQTEQMKLMNLVMGTVTKKADIYGHYGISEFVNFYTACVDPKCRGQGLASYMYELAFKFLRSFPAFKHVKSNLTSPYTRRICEKFGFKELSRSYYNDFCDKDGNRLLSGFEDEEFVSFMAREI